VPIPNPVSLTATLNGGNVDLSFATQSGFSYQVQSKDNVTDATWNNLGSAVEGDGAAKSVNDPATGGKRFYRLQIQ